MGFMDFFKRIDDDIPKKNSIKQDKKIDKKIQGSKPEAKPTQVDKLPPQKTLDVIFFEDDDKKACDKAIPSAQAFKELKPIPKEPKPNSKEAQAWEFKPKVKYEVRPSHEKRGIIVLVVENTATVNDYRNEVLNLLSKIVQGNNSELFLLIRTGAENKYFDILTHEQLVSGIIEKELLPSNVFSQEVKLADAISYIHNFVKTYVASYKLIEFKEAKYIIDNIRMIFVGTGMSDENSEDVKRASELLKDLRLRKEVKAIKYFCINDKNTVNAALVGFPIIGHIESNFYK